MSAMINYVSDFPTLLLNILELKREAQRSCVEKNSAVIKQNYELGATHRQEENDTNDRLKEIKKALQAEHLRLPFLPKYLNDLIHINRLLMEFKAEDHSLSLKLNTLIHYLEDARLDAINHDQKDIAKRLSEESQLAKAALAEHDRLVQKAT